MLGLSDHNHLIFHSVPAKKKKQQLTIFVACHACHCGCQEVLADEHRRAEREGAEPDRTQRRCHERQSVPTWPSPCHGRWNTVLDCCRAGSQPGCNRAADRPAAPCALDLCLLLQAQRMPTELQELLRRERLLPLVLSARPSSMLEDIVCCVAGEFAKYFCNILQHWTWALLGLDLALR